MSDYEALTSVPDFDHEKGRELAELHTEMEAIKRRLRFLHGIADKHMELNQYLWRTYDGRYMLVHDMDDNHLKNAVNFTLEKRGMVPPVLLAEYRKRFGDELPKAKENGNGNLLSSPRMANHDDEDYMF